MLSFTVYVFSLTLVTDRYDCAVFGYEYSPPPHPPPVSPPLSPHDNVNTSLFYVAHVFSSGDPFKQITSYYTMLKSYEIQCVFVSVNKTLGIWFWRSDFHHDSRLLDGCVLEEVGWWGGGGGSVDMARNAVKKWVFLKIIISLMNSLFLNT